MAVSVEGLRRVEGPGRPAGRRRLRRVRALYNGMIDKRPAAIAYCTDEADVAAALRYGSTTASRSPCGAAATTAGASARSTTDW